MRLYCDVEGLQYLKSFSLSKCHYLDNEGIALLPLVKDSLLELDLSYSVNLTSQCLPHLHQLQ